MKTPYLLLKAISLLALGGYPIRINPAIREEVTQLRIRGFYCPDDADLIVRAVVLDPEYSIRAADNSQGWIGAKVALREQEGRSRPMAFVFIRGLGYERPKSSGRDVIDATSRDYLIRAQVGDVIVTFLRANKQLTRWCKTPVYNNITSYKIEKEANKAMEPTPVSVTIPAAQEVAPLTSVAHL